MTADPQTNPWVSKGNILACAVLVIAIAYVLVQIVYLFVDTSVGDAPSVYGDGNTAGMPVSSEGSKVDTSAIALWSLFGKEGAKPVETTQTTDVDAPETRLALELQAVFVSPDKERSSAMIAEARKESLLYRVGDKVPGNVSLEAVHPDRVLLNRNGLLEALYFPENAGAGMSRAGSAARGRDARSANLMRRSGSDSGRKAFGSRPGAGGGLSQADMQAAMTGQMVGALREQLDQNPSEVLTQFGLASNNGRGYRVSESANPMLAAAGARPGDLILAVNGRSLGDPQQDVGLIEEVMQDGSIRISLERNGRAFESEFQLPGR